MSIRQGLPDVLLATILASCGCGTDATVSAKTPGAGLVLEPASLELRADDRDDRHRDVTCRLVNRGNEEIRITSVDTSCACTLAAPLEKTRLKPGESVPLRLKASLPYYGRKESLVKVAVEPASVAVSTLRLILHGPERPVPHVELVPDHLRLSGRRPGETVSQEFQIATIERPNTEPWIRGFADPTGEVEVVLTAAPFEEPRGELVLRTYQYRVEAALPGTADATERFTLVVNGDPMVTRNSSPVVIHGIRVLVPLVHVVPAQLVVRRKELAEGPVTRRVLVITTEGGLSLDPPHELPEWITLEPVGANGSPQTQAFDITFTAPSSHEETVETVQFGVREAALRDTAVLVVSVTP